MFNVKNFLSYMSALFANFQTCQKKRMAQPLCVKMGLSTSLVPKMIKNVG